MDNINKVTRYLKEEARELPEDMIILGVIFRIAQIAQHFRIRINTRKKRGEAPLLNMYILLFAESGLGKSMLLDRTYRLFIEPVYKDMVSDFMNGREKHITRVISNAEQDTEEGELSPKEVAKMKRELEKINRFELESGRGTLQGFLRAREAVDFAGIGGSSFVQDELSSFLKGGSEVKELMDLLKEGHNGNTSSKLLGTTRGYRAVKGVPLSLFGATSPFRFLGDSNREYLEEFFNLGYARRSILCVAQREEFEDEELTIDNFEDLMVTHGDDDDEVMQIIAENIYSFCSNLESIDVSKEADFKLAVYYKDNIKRATEVSSEMYQSEMNDRWMRSLKLSAILAIADGHPMILAEHMEKAIEMIEKYGEDFRSFFENQYNADLIKLFEFFKTQENQDITTRDIYAQGFGGSRRKQWLDENIPQFEEYVASKGYRLKITKNSRGWKRYKLVEQGKLRSDDEREIIKLMSVLARIGTSKDTIWETAIQERDKRQYEVDDGSLEELYDIVVLGKNPELIDEDFGDIEGPF